MPDEHGEQPPSDQPPGEQLEFMEQVIARTVAGLREQGPDWYRGAGEAGEALAANAARMALWLAGLRPGGLRVVRLLSGYEVELTPQDPLGFVQHLSQALVGEAVTSHQAESPEEATKAMAMEIANATNQVTADVAPFVIRSLLWQLCGGLLQQTLTERAAQKEVEARRGSGKREGPPEPSDEAPAPEPEPVAETPVDAPRRPRLIRPGEPEDDGPPPPLIFPGRR